MAGAGGIRAGRAYVEIGGDNRGLFAALGQAAGGVAGLAGRLTAAAAVGVAGLGAALAGAVGGSLTAFASLGGALDDFSGRTGLTVETLSRLQYAAQQGGASAEQLEVAIRTLQRGMVDAGDGTGPAAEAFARLGVNVAELRNLSADEQFTRIARAVGEIQDPALRTATAMQLFGRSGTALLPAINNLDALSSEAERLGAVMTTEQAALGDQLGDAFDSLGSAAKFAAAAIGEQFAPIAIDAITAVANAFGMFTGWVQANGETIQWFIDLGVTAFGYFRDYIVGVFTLAAFQIEHWHDILRLYMLGGSLAVVKFANTTVYFFEDVLPAYMLYFAENWREVFANAANWFETVFTNMAVNALNFFDALWAWMSGDEFNFQWTGLLDGFESTLAAMPAIAEREIGGLEAELQSEFTELGLSLGQEFAERFAENSATATELLKPPALARAARQGPAVSGALVAQAAQVDKFVSAGTFGGAAARGLLGPGSALGAIEKNTKATVDAVNRTTRAVEDQEGPAVG
ncbi:MAG: hypothetical protein IT450_17925 [Phycisphaerales bacterium]|nr:hypothetical protein [Phycisphaerales bacterium]